MKNRILLVFSLLGFLALGATFSLMQKPLPLFNQSKEVMADFADNKDLWKQVDSLAAQGLPQSALELVNRIFIKAKTDNNMPEFLKAALYQLRLRSEFEENYIENYIGETEKNLSSSPSPARQVLHSILADLYWQYYQQNRYRILDQTAVINNNSENIASWDAKMFVNKTAEHYMTSVEEPQLLQSVSLKIYDPILETAGNSKKFRPTLFDFLAHRAIDFFSNEEAAVTKPINPFIMTDPVLLSTPEQLAGLNISTNDKRSFHYNAILLLQEVEKFHLADQDPLPLVDASLKRLEFVRNHLNYQAKDSLYLNTLTTLEEKYTNNPVSTDIIEKIASYWYSGTVQADFKRPYNETPKPDNNFVTARNWCLKAIEKFPDSDGAKNCLVLLRSIEEPSLSFQTDLEVVPGKAFPILVNFRNQKTIFLRLLKPEYDKDAGLKQEIYGERGLEKYLAMKPEKEWSITLPETGDFNQHSVEVIIPAIETGYYALMISGNAAFNRSESPVSVKDFWSSNVSYTSKRNEDGSGLFYLLDRSSGLPLQGVNIKSFTREYDYRSRSYIRKDNEQYTTGKDGSFSIKSYSGRDFSTLSFDFSYKNDRLVAENYFSRYRNNESVKAEKIRTFFFTDRAIYRPGQAVYFKGIVVGTEGENNRIVSDNRSTITLFDANGQIVNTIEVTSNSFGSFSGSFVLPVSGLNGQFRISNNSGSTFINVEEYKRPKFEVTFQPLTSSYRLNEQVSLSGKAESYSGIPISEANVSYRVVRSANFPFFRYGMRSWPGMWPESEIANGTLTTLADGTFTVNFTASPDPGYSGNLDPVYNYTVYANVTDINGETRSGLTSVQVSEKALVIGLDIPALLNRDETKNFRLTALNLNGKPTPANVTIEVFRLMDEDRLTRPRHWNTPDLAIYTRDEFIKQLPSDIYMNEDEKAARKDKSVYKNTFNTASDSLISIPGISKWETGLYLVSLNATDAFGQKVSTDKEITIFSPNAKRIPVKQAFWANLLTQEVKSGEKIRLLAGTAAKNARIHYEVQLKGRTVFSEWIVLSQEQKILEFQVPSDFTGVANISLNMVSDNRSYNFNTSVDVPDTKHLLNIAFETFRSPLLPGGTEKWKLKVTGPDGKPLAAELLAGMYDASLDAFTMHQWYFSVYEKWFEVYNWEISRAFESGVSYASPYVKDADLQGVSRPYDQLNWFGYNMFGGRIYGRDMQKGGILRNEAMAMPEAAMQMDGEAGQAEEKTLDVSEDKVPSPDPEPQIRRNLNETAFFYPQLTTNEQGEIQLEFTVPEALTKWNFMGLAHTADLRFGQIAREVFTRKELMVTPNLPRFFREGDHMVIQTKVSNLTSNPIQGESKLQLFDAINLKPLDELMKNQSSSRAFSLDASGNTVVNWEIDIPAGIDAVMVRITAQAGNHSDGEEVILPVLINRMLVTETLMLPVNGNETRNFGFSKLLNEAEGSTTIRNHRLTLEYTSNPAWYAVQALPYMAEQTHDNADQVFDRLYANSLAAYIANSSPKIRSVFESWKNLTPDALLSNLEKNQELKALIIEETPWLMEAKSESAQKQRIALMFDLNRMATEQKAARQKLQQLQSVNGGWPWFEGMPESRYITQVILTGFGKMHYLKIIDLKRDEVSLRMVKQAASYLSERLVEDYERILKDYPKDLEKNHLNQDHIQFLYSMTYLSGVVEPSDKASKAIAYFSSQARKYWTNQGLYTQGMIALWAGRNGDGKTSASVLKSLRERALTNPELGMYWRDNRGGFFWHEAPVETQALMIELFGELGNDPKATGLLKTWLLKQKQTQSWATSRATAEAVYALLLRGSDWLQTDPGVKITLGGQVIDPKTMDVTTESGTGYFKTSWSGNGIKPAMGNVSVSKSTEGPAWGALYWQYFEDLDKISTHDSPLKISKKLYIKTNTGEGPVLQEISESNPLRVGQQLIVRIELFADRNLEYVHLKDMRASGFEPVNTLSGYRWNGGLGYYENTRDAATNFFFSYLPKGTWVFEYPLVVAQKGEFSNGISSVQCMYSPEFSAHSEGIRVIVR